MLSKMAEKVISDNGGNKRFRCFIKLHSKDNTTPRTWVECRIPSRKKPDFSGSGKITLVAECTTIVHGKSSTKIESAVLSNYSFIDGIVQGTIIVKRTPDQHIDKIKYIEPLCGDAYLVHEVDVVV